MAPAKSESAVTHQVLPNGDHGIGPTIDGVFVPFAVKDPAHVATLVEAGKSPEAKAAAGGDSGSDE